MSELTKEELIAELNKPQSTNHAVEWINSLSNTERELVIEHIAKTLKPIVNFWERWIEKSFPEVNK